MNGEQEKILMLKKLILNTLKIKYNILFIFFFFFDEYLSKVISKKMVFDQAINYIL